MRNSFLLASKNSYVGDGFSTETNLQFSRFRWNYADPVNGAGPNTNVIGPDGLTVAILGHPGYYFDDLENALQFQQKLNIYRENHTFKTGVEVISSDFQLAGGGNPDGSYTVQVTEDQLAQLAALDQLWMSMIFHLMCRY